MGNQTGMPTQKLQETIDETDDILAEFEMMLSDVQQKEDKLIDNLEYLNQFLDEEIKNWKEQNRNCNQFKGVILKFCQEDVNYFKKEIVEPLLIWLKQRSYFYEEKKNLVYPEDGIFFLKGINYVFKYILFINYFDQYLQKFNEPENRNLHQLILKINNQLIGCDEKSLSYRFLLELDHFLIYLKKYDPSKYNRILKVHKYLYNICLNSRELR